jgi:hypothetical protein
MPGCRLVWLLAAALTAPLVARQSATTTITVSSTVVVPSVKRFGIQMSDHTYYDRLVLKNLLWHNSGFEALQYSSVVRCASGTATGCLDDNPSTQWPTGFFDGGTYEFILGEAKGRSGTIASFVTAPRDNVTGSTFTFADSGTAPAAGSYFIARKYMPGGGDTGWNLTTLNGATITTETSDLPPDTGGRQSLRLTATGAGQSATINNAFGAFGETFVIMNGSYRISFKAKQISGGSAVQVSVARGSNTFVSSSVSLSSSWGTYTLDFRAAETGVPPGLVVLAFQLTNTSALFDDVTLVQTDSDVLNTTAFRDPVIAALRTFNPSFLRVPNKEQAETLENLIAPPLGKIRTGYNVYANTIGIMQPGWQEFLDLCEFLHTDPWLVIPMTFSNQDVVNLMEYLGGSSSTPYGARRAARGHPTPWTSVFSRIHLEMGNETWNAQVYRGATLFPADYGVRGHDVFGMVRQSPYYSSSQFNLILNVQTANAFNGRATHNASANHDMLAHAPYIATQINDYESNERLFGGLFAEASFWSRASNGPVKTLAEFINATPRPVPLAVYEVNLHTTEGSIPQATLDAFAPSIGAGLAVANHMLIMLRDFATRDQSLFALAGYRYTRTDGKTVLIWGVTRDMGVTDRKRPQYLAAEIINQALAGDMVGTAHTGADPHWDQPLTNRIAIDNVAYLQSFAVVNGVRKALILFNLHRTQALQVNLAGPNAPAGAATTTRLTSANITDSNENASVVKVETTQEAAFDPRQTMTLPPFSLTVIISDAPAIPLDVQATAQSAGQVAVGWTASFGAARYEVQRRTATQPFQLVATSTGTSYTDTAVSPGSAYLYRVRAVGSDDTPSAYSSADLSTTTTFTDDPLTAGQTPIRAAHLAEIRAAVNAIESLAGVTPSVWTDPSIAGSSIKAVHIIEMRTALTNAFAVLGLQAPSFARTITVGATTIQASEWQELRAIVR